MWERPARVNLEMQSIAMLQHFSMHSPSGSFYCTMLVIKCYKLPENSHLHNRRALLLEC